MGGTICRAGRSRDQVSRSILWLPWYFVNRFLEATRIAEETLGHPPTVFEIFVTLKETQGSTVNNVFEVVAVLFSMLREDLIYCSKNSDRYSVHKQEGYLNYSEIFRKHFPNGYACDPKGRVVPTTARRVNYRQLKGILTSTD